MLHITVPARELFDEIKQEFITTKEYGLTLEHSLVSLSKWEAKYCKPFLSKEEKTFDESIDYIKCMCMSQNIDDSVFKLLTTDNISEINTYIEAPMTATWYKREVTNQGRVVTSELIYYWMIALNIPFECQKWHLNRLLTLINVCNLENQPKKKMSKKEVYSRNAAINAARKAKMNSKG
jgi:hypothetical protein|uniref:Uncharacterized protein n=1 Tax=Siphoviridae sp. ctSWe10 TaxID=2826344 RepID=A0A8S5NQR5_9CAUD|nr:MAG TPA: hypothetical protein [Siphoviridae sp. ctSWe10]